MGLRARGPVSSLGQKAEGHRFHYWNVEHRRERGRTETGGGEEHGTLTSAAPPKGKPRVREDTYVHTVLMFVLSSRPCG